MFSLIITIIAIALVAALALATLMYGGTAFSKGGADAGAARVINESQQVKGAIALYNTQENGETLTSLDALVNQKALAQVPDGWSVTEGFLFKSETQTDVCLAANKKIGVNLIPTCADPAYANVSVCCSAPN